MRELLQAVLRDEGQFEAFCIDHFDDVHGEFAPGSTRTDRTNLLLTRHEPLTVLAALRDYAPENAKRYKAIIDDLLAPRARPSAEKTSFLALSRELRDEIVAIAEREAWSPQDLADAYHESAPPGWHNRCDLSPRSSLVKAILATLADALRQQDGTHPILRFVLHLQRLAGSSDRQVELGDWVTAAANQLRVSPEAQEAMRSQVSASAALAARQLHLVVVVRELARSTKHYRLHAFRVLVPPYKDRWEDTDVRPLPESGDRDFTIDDMPAYVSELVDSLAGERRRSNDQLTIELVAPLAFLWRCDADQWQHLLDLDVTSRLGVSFQVVLRSWERAYASNPRSLPAWEAKWRRVGERGAASAFGLEAAARGLVPLLNSAGPVCVALEFAPECDGTAPTPRVLRELIATGTPVAVWPRSAAVRGGKLQDSLRRLLGTPPSRWPAEVQLLRCDADASEDQDHPGRHMALLWDDPRKLPPDARAEARLVSPTAKEKDR